MGLQMNLIKNAGMEEGTNFWTAESNATLASDTSEHSGLQELKVTAGADNVGATQELLFEDASFYEVLGWLKTTAGDVASIWIDKGDGTPVKLASLSNTTSYARKSSIFKSVGLPGNIYLRGDSNTDIVWFDDIAVIHRPDLDATINFLDEGYHYIASKNDKGVYIRGGDALYYNNTIINDDQFSFLVRGELQFEPGTSSPDGSNKYLLQTYFDAENYFAVYFDVLNSDWVLDITSDRVLDGTPVSDTTIRTTNTQSFSIGDEIEISGWYSSEGHVVDGVRSYGAIFINGLNSGSVTSAPTIPVTTTHSATLFIGGSYASATTSTNQADFIFDEVVIWAVALNNDDCAALYTSGTPIQNTNATWSYSGTLAAQDVLTYAASNGASELYDASAGTESSPGSSLSGKNPSLRGDEEEKSLIYLPESIGQCRVVMRPHFR